MPLIELSPLLLVLINIAAWAFFHVAVSLMTLKLPEHWFNKDSSLYQIRSWEKDGRLWQQYFNVKKWKHLVPDGAKLFNKGFQKRELRSKEVGFLQTFVLESRRAELTHWLSMPPALLFFLWNPAWAGWVMIAYAILLNGPIIILQRYNRARLQRVVAGKQQAYSVRQTIAEL